MSLVQACAVRWYSDAFSRLSWLTACLPLEAEGYCLTRRFADYWTLVQPVSGRLAAEALNRRKLRKRLCYLCLLLLKSRYRSGRAQGFSKTDQILRIESNDAAAPAVDVDEKERDGHNKRWNQKQDALPLWHFSHHSPPARCRRWRSLPLHCSFAMVPLVSSQAEQRLEQFLGERIDGKLQQQQRQQWQ
jgi:hypothetical protein